jgi:hypothetical protein
MRLDRSGRPTWQVDCSDAIRTTNIVVSFACHLHDICKVVIWPQSKQGTHADMVSFLTS